MNLIELIPDPNIEPGHQWITLPITPQGSALCRLLTGMDAGVFTFKTESGSLVFRLPHDADVDQRILELINQLAHARFSAPGLVQLTMETPG